jgi:hypothetical protein
VSLARREEQGLVRFLPWPFQEMIKDRRAKVGRSSEGEGQAKIEVFIRGGETHTRRCGEGVASRARRDREKMIREDGTRRSATQRRGARLSKKQPTKV